jgi:Zn-dependent protease
MQGTWRFFTAFNIPVKIHWSFGLIFVWVFFVGWFNAFEVDKILWLGLIFLGLFICVILHEYGHALTARWFGVGTKDIILSPIGGLARLEKLPQKPMQELLIALAGPLVNFAIALLLIALIYVMNKAFIFENPFFSNLDISVDNFLRLMFDMNLALGLLNLIPAFPMDGGRILRALLSLRLDSSTATKWAAYLGQGIAVIAIILGFTIIKNPVLPIVGAFIFFLANQEFRNLKFTQRLDALEMNNLLRTDFTRIYLEDTIDQVSTKKMGHENSFLIFDQEENLVGVLHATFLKDALKRNKGTEVVSTYLSTNFEILPYDIKIKSVYYKMQNAGYSILPVFKNDQIIGVIDRSGFVKALG